MPLVRSFKWSFYITVALAGMCLAYANIHFLSLMGVFQIFFLALIVFAFLWEGRRHLGTQGANILGIVIGIVFVFWIYWNIPQKLEDFVGGLPWPARLLPVMAPILPTLMNIKLFRPKTLADFWSIQVLGLIMVTLSCVLVSQPLFFPLLVLYMVFFTWCLALYYLHQQRVLAENPGKAPEELPLFGEETPLPARAAGSWRGLPRALRWTLPAVLLGTLFFLLAPRLYDQQWEPNKLSTSGTIVIKTGIGPDMNLNRVGTLELNNAPAFDVALYNDEGPLRSLPGQMRWRVQVLDYYAEGKWLNWVHTREFQMNHVMVPVNPPDPTVEPQDPEVPPELTAHELYLAFRTPPDQAGGLPLAEPIVYPDKIGLWQHSPRGPVRRSFFSSLPGADFYQAPRFRPMSFQLRYGQITNLSQSRDDTPAHDISEDYVSWLQEQASPHKVEVWTRNLLHKLKPLTLSDLAIDQEGRLLPENHEKVARAITAFLALSGQFTYSLKIRRVDTQLDPTVDFLHNVREGPCEHYAAALTLMLRSVGIPARIVRGFRGGNFLGDGRVQVMQDTAHAWVEVLLRRDQKFSWLSLDPTPANEVSQKALFTWFLENIRDPEHLWRSLVLDYNPAMQNEMASRLWTSVAPNTYQALALRETWVDLLLPFVIPCLGLGGFLLYRLVSRQAEQTRAATTLLSFHGRLLELLSRHFHVQPEAGQTPLEFAQQMQALLAQDARTIEFAEVPLHVVNLLYRIRFGGLDATTPDREHVERELDALERAVVAPA